MHSRKDYLLIILFSALLVVSLNLLFNPLFSDLLNERLSLLLSLGVFLIIGFFIARTIINSSKEIFKNYKPISLKRIDSKLVYGKDWIKDDYGFTEKIYFDILVDNEFLYLLELPVKNNVLKGFVERDIADYLQIDDNAKLRKSWFDEKNNQIISDEYKKYIFINIPLSSLNGAVSVKMYKIQFNYQDKKIYLRSSKNGSKKKLQNFLNNFFVQDLASI